MAGFENGVKMAAAYSVKPNELGRCGESGAFKRLDKYIRGEGVSEEEARAVLAKFEVAMPYYRLIAAANGIDDPFDIRVVSAYWIGNELLEKVGTDDIRKAIENDVAGAGWRKQEIAIMFSALKLNNARAHHALSVFYFFAFVPRAISKMILADGARDRIDSCRVNVGEIQDGGYDGRLWVNYRPLAYEKGCMVFSKDKLIQIPRGYAAQAKKGDLLSFHLGMGVEVLSEEETKNLRHYTQMAIDAVNR